MSRRRGRPPHNDLLTPAEWRTVHAVRHGLTNREIAKRRGISLDAVKFHVANAIAKLGVANRKALRHWSGAPVDSLLSSGDKHVNENFEIIGLGQIARTVRDVRLSEKWYREVLGLAHLYTFGSLAFFDCGGTRLMLSERAEIESGESILYLRVISIEAAYDDLKKRGVQFVDAPHMIHRHEDGTEEWMAFFNDLEGRTLAIMSQVSPDDGPAA